MNFLNVGLNMLSKTLNAFFSKPCFWSHRCTKLSY